MASHHLARRRPLAVIGLILLIAVWKENPLRAAEEDSRGSEAAVIPPVVGSPMQHDSIIYLAKVALDDTKLSCLLHNSVSVDALVGIAAGAKV